MRPGARRFLALFGMGAVGIAALAPTAGSAVSRLREEMARRQGQSPADLPSDAILTALSLMQPAVLLAVAVLVGMRFAPALGLRSHVDERMRGEAPRTPGFAGEVPLALAVGVAVGVVILLIDALVRPMLAGAVEALAGSSRTAAITIAGVLYGGITEELLLRWGLMTLLLALIWRLIGRRGGTEDRPVGGAAAGGADGLVVAARDSGWSRADGSAAAPVGGGHRPPRVPPPVAAWAAILLAALLFGAGHLPAVAAAVPLTPLLVVRTVALNAVGGTAFGWMFWRRSLESAMVAHATVHVVFTIAEAAIGAAAGPST